MSDEAKLLRRAAALVRETAAPANDTDWRVAVDSEGQLVMGAGGSEIAECRDPHDASYIALVGRQMAEPLAGWLEGAAAALNDYPGFSEPGGTWFRFATSEDQAPAYRHAAQYVVGALAVARGLLGEATS